MSDNQSWNSSGSEEDIEPREEPGHHVGVVDLSGVLSKVSCFILITPIKSKQRGDVSQSGGQSQVASPPIEEFSGFSHAS